MEGQDQLQYWLSGAFDTLLGAVFLSHAGLSSVKQWVRRYLRGTNRKELGVLQQTQLSFPLHSHVFSGEGGIKYFSVYILFKPLRKNRPYQGR